MKKILFFIATILAGLFITDIMVVSKTNERKDEIKVINLNKYNQLQILKLEKDISTLDKNQQLTIDGKVYTAGQILQEKLKRNSEIKKIRLTKKITTKTQNLVISNFDAQKARRMKIDHDKINSFIKKNDFSKIKIIPPGSVPVATNSTDSENPKIERLDKNEGEPGMKLFIVGEKFGDTQGTVQFACLPGKTIAGSIDFWTEHAISVFIPSYEGIADAYNGTVIVKDSQNRNSNTAPFKFNPELVIRKFSIPMIGGEMTGSEAMTLLSDPPYPEIDEDNFFTCSRSIRYSYGDIQIAGGFFSGCKGSELLLKNIRLKNNWVVHDIVAGYSSIDPESTMEISNIKKGTNNPEVTINYTITPHDNINFVALLVYLRGPKGTSPK